MSQIVDEEKGEAVHDAKGEDYVEVKTPISQTFTLSSRLSTTSKNLLVKTNEKVSSKLASLRRCFRFDSCRKPAGRREFTPIVRSIHEQADGYPKLATFLDADENFMTYRRFGYLQARLLLEKQDDLRRLELELDCMDKQDYDLDESSLKNRNDYGDEDWKDRVELIEKIEKKWLEYSNLLKAAQTLTAFNKPTANERRSVKRWLEQTYVVADSESSFIRCTEDLITLRPGREHAWLDRFIEDLLSLTSNRCPSINNLFRSSETREKSNGDAGVELYTRARIESFVITLFLLLSLVLLVVPIYTLYRLTRLKPDYNHNLESIGIMLISTLLFAACMSLLTRARKHEILAAAAAYCAVLVVFIGNVVSSGP